VPVGLASHSVPLGPAGPPAPGVKTSPEPPSSPSEPAGTAALPEPRSRRRRVVGALHGTADGRAAAATPMSRAATTARWVGRGGDPGRLGCGSPKRRRQRGGHATGRHGKSRPPRRTGRGLRQCPGRHAGGALRRGRAPVVAVRSGAAAAAAGTAVSGDHRIPLATRPCQRGGCRRVITGRDPRRDRATGYRSRCRCGADPVGNRRVGPRPPGHRGRPTRGTENDRNVEPCAGAASTERWSGRCPTEEQDHPQRRPLVIGAGHRRPEDVELTGKQRALSSSTSLPDHRGRGNARVDIDVHGRLGERERPSPASHPRRS
jgi:hypothetical protein